MAGKIEKINIRPDYKRIYMDIIKKKYPEKIKKCLPILEKELLTVFDIISLNNEIFGFKEQTNTKYRSYINLIFYKYWIIKKNTI